MEYAKQITQDLLTMIYQYAGISFLCSVLFIFVWKQAEETSWKSIWIKFKSLLKERKWKKRFLLVLYIIFVLQRTIFNRSPWGNPLSNVIGNWWFLKNDVPNYEMAENILLFIPLYPLVKICRVENRLKIIQRYGYCNIIIIPFICSLLIEIIQLMFRVGTFQLSDIFYNTFGGLLGGAVYYIGGKIQHRNWK